MTNMKNNILQVTSDMLRRRLINNKPIVFNQSLSKETIETYFQKVKYPLSSYTKRCGSNYGVIDCSSDYQLSNLEITYPGSSEVDYLTFADGDPDGSAFLGAVGTECEDGIYFVCEPIPVPCGFFHLCRVSFNTNDTLHAQEIPRATKEKYNIYNGSIDISDDNIEKICRVLEARDRIASLVKKISR